MMAMMCAAQMMKTLILLICLGYVIDHDPGPTLIVQPTGDDAESFSTERIGPMIESVTAVAEKMSKAASESKARSTGNKILQKRFRGGQVSLTGAISDSGLRRRSVRYLMLDEVDAEGYEATKNGDRVRRAIMRTVTYWNRKIILCSTPTVVGGRISNAYEEGDQRQFFVPCPFCGHRQVLAWSNVLWGDRAKKAWNIDIPAHDAHYQCANQDCGKAIPHYRKTEMLAAGRWIAQNPEGRYPSYQISRLYAPDWSWGRVVVELFIPAKDSQEAMRQFKNEVLAEPWKESGEAPDWEKLMGRCEESYRLGQPPKDVLFLTCGTDAQKTWLEGYVWGWGRQRQRWLVDQFRIEHNPFEQAAWDGLTEQLNRTYRRADGAYLSIVKMAVDTGYASNEVYRWAREQGGGRVMAVDGRPRLAALVVPPTQVDVTVGGRKIKNGAKLWPVDVSACKSELYGLLSKERPKSGDPYPAGWIHFPKGIDDEFFKQLTAERLVTHVVKGYRKTEWVKDPALRNEALDCANYARAAALVYGLDRFGSNEAWWQRIAGMMAPAPQQTSGDDNQMTATAAPPRQPYISPSRRRIVGRMAL